LKKDCICAFSAAFPDPRRNAFKVLVPVKRVLDYSLRPVIKADGSGMDLAGLKMSMNPFDEIALEEAIRMKESGKAGDIVAVSCGGNPCRETLRMALALGADRAVLIETDLDVQPLGVAKLLAALAVKESPGLVICGKQAIDDDAGQVGPLLAGLLGWPQATFASKVIIKDGRAEVTREIDGGLETLEVRLPAVITTDLRLNEPRYAALPNILKAKQKPLDVFHPEGLGVDVTPRITVLKTIEPPSRRACIRVADAAELVRRLREDARVI